jgi:uncharacterized protein (TIGR01244 family)
MKWLAPAGQRRGAVDWLELIFKDHGFLRLCWHNQHQIADHVWRSNQPGPGRIAKLGEQGIKTIINLRGPRDDGGWQLESEACKKAGITLLDFTARSRAAPSKDMLHDARALFAAAEKPLLMHCKSGADRAGLMAALYMLVAEQQPASIAMQQLAWKYGHVKAAKTGLLDAFFAAYLPYEQDGMPFYEWIDTIYDPDDLAQRFTAQGWAVRLTDTILRRE